MKIRITRNKHFKIVKKNPTKPGWLHISIWSLTAVDFFDLDRLFVKDEIPEYSPPLILKWRQGDASTTRNLINNVGT